jgi:bifunctional UDP-N-acetylglucosamine pyrophosphorylase/glucosamine-1-phosphate N-acetyltransferase
MESMDRTQVAALVLGSSARANHKQAISSADPLAPIAGRSVLGWVIEAAIGASIRRIGVVVDEPGPRVRSEVARRTDSALIDFMQPDGLDSIDSIALAIERVGPELVLSDNSHLLLLSASAPQIESGELRALISDHIASGAAATVLGHLPEARGDGEPIVRSDAEGNVTSILEPIDRWAEDEATIACVRASLLAPALRRVMPRGWQSEPLLTDAFVALRAAGHAIHEIPRPTPVPRIVSAATRAPIEAEMRRRVIHGWLERGVAIPAPEQVSIDATVELGQGVQVLPGTLLEGTTSVGDGAVLGPNAQLTDAAIGAGVVAGHVVVRGAEVPAHERLAPFTTIGSVHDQP